MLWLCLDFPQLALELFSRALADDRHCVVVENRRVYRCSPGCAALAIDQGMSVATAQALCADLYVIERSPAREQKELAALADSALRFTPMVSIEAPRALLLEISGSIRLFHGLRKLLQQLHAEFDERGFSLHTALAPTAAAAALLARGKAGDDWPAYCDPDSTAIDHDAFLQRLGTLPVSILDSSDRQRRQMRDTGIELLSELLSLPGAAVGRRFGRDFLLRLERIRGSRADPRKAVQAAHHFAAALQFPHGVSELGMLRFPMQRLLRELCCFLRRRQAWCQTLCWRLLQNDRREHNCELRCHAAGHDSDSLLQLSLLRLEEVRLSAAVESISLSCSEYAPLEPGDAVLFRELTGSTDRRAQQADGLLLDRLCARVGDNRVYGISRADEHLPEQAWQRCQPAGLGAAPPAQNDISAAPRPAWLLVEPHRLSRRQQGLYWNGDITLLNGPERIENPWRRGAAARDYFIARHENGSLYWVYRQLDSDTWYVHGLFA